MLPSNGYFKNLLCPYFEQNNCTRVFCHFKHKISESANYIPTPVHVLQKQQNQPLLKKSKFPDYKPTPIDKLKNHGKTNDLKNNDEKKDSAINLNDKVNENVFKNIESKLSSIFDISDDETDDIQIIEKKEKTSEDEAKESKSKNFSGSNKNKLETNEKGIFSKKHLKQKNKVSPVISQNEQESNPITKKVRVAHKMSEDSKTLNVLLANKNMRMTPAQMMFNRFVTAQENIEKKEEKVLNDKESSLGKKRIAHTPSLKISSSSNDNNIKKIKRPVLPLELGGKVSTQIRQRYLNLIIEEYLKTDNDEEKVYEKALIEEKNIYKRSPSKSTYLNLSVNAIKRIRDSVKTKEDIKKN